MNTATKHWIQFCKSRHKKPFTFEVNQVLEFLKYLSTDLELSYNAVQDGKQFVMAINKLKKVGMSSDEKEVITKFMKGVFNKKPPIKQRLKLRSWNVDIVLDHLVSGADNKVMDLSELAGKLCLLIPLNRMCRIGELAILDLEKMEISEGSVCFTLPVPTKTFTTGSCNEYIQGLQRLTLKRFPNPAICPVEALYTYLKRTVPFQANVNKVFIIVDQSLRPASRQTLSCWTKNILTKAGLGNFTVHSECSAASTCALLLGLPIDCILKQARWKPKSTFVKYYMNSPYIKCDGTKDKYQFSEVWSDKTCGKLRDCDDEKIDRFRSKHGDLVLASCSQQRSSTLSQSTCTSPGLRHQYQSTSTQSTLP